MYCGLGWLCLDHVYGGGIFRVHVAILGYLSVVFNGKSPNNGSSYRLYGGLGWSFGF